MVGPLVGKGIKLKRDYLVTTTWGEWKKQHPDTTVLSLDTGHNRNYGEGVAYQAYFANDRLMFSVPELDTRLPNKAEVVALREGNDQLAIHEAFLRRNRLYRDKLDGKSIVVFTDHAGGNRVYESGDVKFVSISGQWNLVDATGATWKVTEENLTGNGRKLKRVASHRAFWFGWKAQFPDTRLVK